MKDSSMVETVSFRGIEWHNVLKLLDVLVESSLLTTEYIARRFKERGTGFPETLEFLLSINALHRRTDHLALSSEVKDAAVNGNRAELQACLLTLLLHHGSGFRTAIYEYVRHFELHESEVLYCAARRQLSRHSFVRNFLMEIGVVAYEGKPRYYRLAPEYNYLYIDAMERSKVVSPSTLVAKLSDQADIGLLAEQRVLSYEKERVGPGSEHLIDHISRRNAAVGYDIKSVTQGKGKTLEPRYVEVKAVSEVCLRFYWTANEIRVAKLLGKLYYLYLLPVNVRGGFRLESLRIISDAYAVVLRPRSEWDIAENVISCSLKDMNKR